MQRLRVRDTGAIQIRRFDVALFGQGIDLGRRAMDQNYTDVEGAQYSDIQQDVGEIFVGDDAAINADDKYFFTELRDVLKDAAEVGEFHVKYRRAS